MKTTHYLVAFFGLILLVISSCNDHHDTGDEITLATTIEPSLVVVSNGTTCGTGIPTAFRWPLENWVTNLNGFWSTYNSYDVDGDGHIDPRWHLGSDSLPAQASVGAPVHAPCSGIVRRAASNTGYGGTVIIDCWTGTECVSPIIAHMFTSTTIVNGISYRGLQVSTNDHVSIGDVIGYLADRNNNGGWAPHVHFGIHRGAFQDTPVNSCSGGWSYAGYVYSDLPCVKNTWYDPDVFIPQHQTAPFTYTQNADICRSVIPPTAPDWDAIGQGCYGRSWIEFTPGSTVYALMRIDRPRVNHRFYIKAYHNGQFSWDWFTNRNMVEPDEWDDAYFWSEIRDPALGSWRVELYLIHSCDNEWNPESGTCRGEQVDELTFTVTNSPYFCPANKSTCTPQPQPPCTPRNVCETATRVGNNCQYTAIAGCCQQNSQCHVNSHCVHNQCEVLVCQPQDPCHLPFIQDHTCIQVRLNAICCLADSECPTGEVCGSNNRCQAAGPCVPRHDCEIASMVNGVCQYTQRSNCCTRNTDCASHQQCVNNGCYLIPCAPRDACHMAVLQNHQCVQVPRDLDCCLLDSHCPSGKRCNTTTNGCETFSPSEPVVCNPTDACDDARIVEGICTHTRRVGCCLANSECSQSDRCSGNRCLPVHCNALHACDNAQVIDHVCTRTHITDCCLNNTQCNAREWCTPSNRCEVMGSTPWVDSRGRTGLGQSGSNGGPWPDGTHDHRDDDGDCACEVAPCTLGSINRFCTTLVGGDCDDDPMDFAEYGDDQWSFCRQGSVNLVYRDSSCPPGWTFIFPTDGSILTRPGKNDWPHNNWDDNCDGAIDTGAVDGSDDPCTWSESPPTVSCPWWE